MLLGKAGLPPTESRSIISNAIELFQGTEPKHLTTIKVIVFDDSLLQCFQDLNTAVTTQPQRLLPQLHAGVCPILPSIGTSVDPPSENVTRGIQKNKPLVLTFCSRCGEHTEKVNICSVRFLYYCKKFTSITFSILIEIF